jgi:NADPH:quinone reductase-like Zn-dependent oxidoreductase
MQIPESRKVIQLEQFGGPEVLRERTLAVPVPGPGELLVKVAAAGVNPVDHKIRTGHYPAVQRDKLPYIPGRDLSGTVVQCGISTSPLKEGTKIFAMPSIDHGTYAEYVLVKESEAAPKPGAIDFIHAAAVPLAAWTAWQGLFKYGDLREGQRAEFVRGLGADVVIDYEKQRFEMESDNVDLVFDLVNGDMQERSWEVLKRGGALVSTLKEPSKERAAAKKARACRYLVQESGADLVEINKLIDAGKVQAMVARTFPFELDPKSLAAQGGIAAALGAVATPAAAVLAFLDPGLAKDKNCDALLSGPAEKAAEQPGPPQLPPPK